MLRAFNDSLTFIAWKIQNINSLRSKVVAFSFLSIALLLLVQASNISLLLERTIISPPSGNRNVAFEDLSIQLLTGAAGGEGPVFNGVIIGLLFSVIFIPFFGFAFPSVVPFNDTTIVRKSPLYKISDSILLQPLSAITIIQLYLITILVSLANYKNELFNPQVFIIGWLIWALLLSLTALFGWFVELVYRVFGLAGKLLLGAVITGTIAALVILSPDGIANLYGASGFIGGLLTGDTLQSFETSALTYTGILLLIILINSFTFGIGKIALTKNERSSKKQKAYNAKLKLKFKALKSELLAMKMVVRLPNIWRPILIGNLFGLTSLFLIGSSPQALVGNIILIPMIVSLAWGSNFLGILGSGVTYLASLPGGYKSLFDLGYRIQYTLIVLSLAFNVSVAYFVVGIDMNMLSDFVTAVLIASFLMSMMAINKSFTSPEKYRVDIRGENILPPAKALSYLGRFIIFGGVPGIIAYGNPNNMIQLAILAIAILLQVLSYIKLKRKWMEESLITKALNLNA